MKEFNSAQFKIFHISHAVWKMFGKQKAFFKKKETENRLERLSHPARTRSVFFTAIAATRQQCKRWTYCSMTFYLTFAAFNSKEARWSGGTLTGWQLIRWNQDVRQMSFISGLMLSSPLGQKGDFDRVFKKKLNSSTDNLVGENHMSAKAPHPHKLIFFFTKLYKPAAFDSDWKSPGGGQTAAKLR